MFFASGYTEQSSSESRLHKVSDYCTTTTARIQIWRERLWLYLNGLADHIRLHKYYYGLSCCWSKKKKASVPTPAALDRVSKLVGSSHHFLYRYPTAPVLSPYVMTSLCVFQQPNFRARSKGLSLRFRLRLVCSTTCYETLLLSLLLHWGCAVLGPMTRHCPLAPSAVTQLQQL